MFGYGEVVNMSAASQNPSRPGTGTADGIVALTEGDRAERYERAMQAGDRRTIIRAGRTKLELETRGRRSAAGKHARTLV